MKNQEVGPIGAFVLRHEKFFQRFLEIVPGALTWGFLLSPIWLGIFYPPALAYLLIFVTLYWAYLALRGTLFGVLGFRRYKKEMAVDWAKECEQLDFSELPDKPTLPGDLAQVKHFILIPVVNEPPSVLKPTIDALFNQTFPVDRIMVVFTMEENYSEEVKATIYEALDGREKELAGFLTFTHPAGIPGEAIGAGAANRTWGARHAVEHLTNAGTNIRNFIFTTIDCDHILDPQYIARLTHLYLSSDRRDNRFYSSAVYTFNNNNWRVPAVMRIEANFVTLGTLSDWARVKGESGTKDSFSAYSTSLQTLIDADYWDPSLGIDDTIFYWRAFFVRDGEFMGTPHYIPFSADAVEGKNYWDSYRSLYKQLLRWGYGVIDFPLSIKGFLINKNVSLSKKILWTLKHLHKRVLLINMVFIMTFGFAIATLVNPDIRQTSFAYSLPSTMSVILTIAMIFLIPGTFLRTMIANPMPKKWPLWKKAFAFLEGPMILINLLTYSFIPYVDAQTRMLLGKKMKDLYHTPKVR